MSVSYRGVICVGYTYEEIVAIKEHKEFDGDLYDFYEQEDLNSFSPYFDADPEHCIYGLKLIASDEYSFTEISDVDVKAGLLKELLYNKYGVEAKTYLMADGW